MSSGDNMGGRTSEYILYVHACSSALLRRQRNRAANLVFGKIGLMASKEVTLQIMDSKCIPMLLYGLETCPLLKSDKSSPDFAIDRFFMKVFQTSSITIVVFANLFLILNY